MKSDLIFNTQLEIGLRGVFVLNSLYPLKANLDKLIYLDYLTIYTQDSNLRIKSLHPEYAMRIVELFSRREIMKMSLIKMSSKGLITIEYGDDGICYAANGSTSWFLEGLENDEYSKELKNRAEAIAEKFKNYSNEELKNFIEEKIEDREEKFSEFFPYMDRGV